MMRSFFLYTKILEIPILGILIYQNIEVFLITWLLRVIIQYFFDPKEQIN